jgi:hypothetical protein
MERGEAMASGPLGKAVGCDLVSALYSIPPIWMSNPIPFNGNP